jgi:thioredoxin 1
MNSKNSLRQNLVLKSLCVALLACVAAGCGPQAGTQTATEIESKNVRALTKDTFQKEVLESAQPVFVDFWATWCGPCRTVAPTVAELADEYEGRVKFGKVDVDKETELATRYDVSGIPALMVFQDGKVVEHLVGVRSKDELKSVLEKHLASSKPLPAPASP